MQEIQDLQIKAKHVRSYRATGDAARSAILCTSRTSVNWYIESDDAVCSAVIGLA